MAEEEFVWAVKAEGHLIRNKAGASARAQAERLRADEPIRTRLARLLRVHTDERAYRLGAVGEETVGSRLARLDRSSWLVLHDIVINERGTNIDHIVIGPPGVFSLNTKHRPKAKIVVTERSFLVNGYRENYLPVAVSEAAKVSRTLEASVGFTVPVNPVIVVMGAELEVRSAPAEVSVVRRKDLLKWFLSLPPRLAEDRVQALMHAAGRPSTWTPLSPSEPALSLKPWNRHGLKRLYVNDPSGKSLGFRDEKTGRIHANDPADLDRITAALANH
ncbi:MAG TPA: nuclease-related domain-containing protein [Actinomycetota bacterium]|jgi:hypothetical protein|nr:nuclease-related domain-containing protein [Actinomycetota bacterium]